MAIRETAYQQLLIDQWELLTKSNP